MSVFAVPRSIARSREKSLYSPLNMERSEPWRRVSEARDASKEGQVTQPARARGYARVPLWSRKGSSASQPLAARGHAHHAIAALRLASAIEPLRATSIFESADIVSSSCLIARITRISGGTWIFWQTGRSDSSLQVAGDWPRRPSRVWASHAFRGIRGARIASWGRK